MNSMKPNPVLTALLGALLSVLILPGCQPGGEAESEPGAGEATPSEPEAPNAPATTPPSTANPAESADTGSPEMETPEASGAAVEPATTAAREAVATEEPAPQEAPEESAEEPAPDDEELASEETTEPAETPAEEEQEPAPGDAPEPEDQVLLTTSAGVLVIQLFDEDAPRHCENFKTLVRDGYYDGKTFHRVVDGFIAQGGAASPDGTGGSGDNIPPEAKRKHVRGSVAMAQAGGDTKASHPTQFYICVAPQPELDAGGATVFGQVVYGLESVGNFESYSPEEIRSASAGSSAAFGVLPPNRQTRIVKARVVPSTQVQQAVREANAVVASLKEQARAESPAAKPVPVADSAAGDDDQVVVLTTDIGDIVIDLFEKDTPKHAENFKKLVREDFYDGLTFHRVIDGFMAQGGDPSGDGTGGPGYTLPAEIKRKHLRGSVAAARTNNPEKRSSGSQFYICFQPQPGLDALGYTVFGEVIQGMDVVDRITRGDRRKNGLVPEADRTRIVDAKLAPASRYRE